MSVWPSLYVSACTYIYIYIYICVCVCVCVCARICVLTHSGTRIYLCIWVCIYIYISSFICHSSCLAKYPLCINVFHHLIRISPTNSNTTNSAVIHSFSLSVPCSSKTEEFFVTVYCVNWFYKMASSFGAKERKSSQDTSQIIHNIKKNKK